MIAKSFGMLQGNEGDGALTRHALESAVCKQHEWWCWWREARRKLPKAIALAAAGLLFYACLFALKSHPCWLSASGCWRLADGWNPTSTGESQQLGQGMAEPPTELQHILFGIAASAGSWPRRQEIVNSWWRDSMRGFVWLDGEIPSNDFNGRSLPPIRISANASQLGSAARISRIVSESFRLNLSDVRWFVMGDDDTVFFPDNLAFLLRKYDHRRFFYIGHPSESQAQSAIHSFSMAFGGGGFAISFSLAERLAQMQDRCLERYPLLYGSDGRIEACTAELGVPLTRERGFHQIDLRGDIFGLLAAHPVAPLVSLHHVEAVDPIFPNRTAVQAIRHLLLSTVMDPLGLLQQSFCYDTFRNLTISVSWGYAVQVFEGMRTPLELQRPAATFLDWRAWKREADVFTFNIRALDPNSCQNPSIFYMQDVQVATNDTNISIAQFRRSDNLWRSANCPELRIPQRIKVLKDRHKESWVRAPRRQCCEVLPPMPSMRKSSDLVRPEDRLFHLRVRDCKPSEVIAPRS